MEKEQWQITIYIPKVVRGKDPIERLRRLAKKKRRSINFLVVEAILKYLEQAEKSHPTKANPTKGGTEDEKIRTTPLRAESVRRGAFSSP